MGFVGIVAGNESTRNKFTLIATPLKPFEYGLLNEAGECFTGFQYAFNSITNFWLDAKCG